MKTTAVLGPPVVGRHAIGRLPGLWRPVLAFAVALGLATALFAVTTDAQQMNAGPNVNMVKGTENDPYLQRQAEPSLDVSTRNPCHILAGAVDYRTVDVPDPTPIDPPSSPLQAAMHDSWLGVYKSFDCGATWTSDLIRGFPQDPKATAPLFGYTAGADPIVRAGANGMFFYGGMVFNRDGKKKSAIFVNPFIDNNHRDRGDTFTDLGATILDVSEGEDFLDKPWLAVDIPRNGYGPKAEPWVSSEDLKHFKGDLDEYAPQQVGMCEVNGQRFPAGRIFMAWAKFKKTSPSDPTPAKMMAARSDDCGKSWKIKMVSQHVRTNQGATLAISPADGTAYLAWREFSAAGQLPSIYMVRSTDGGETWSKPTLVSTFNAFDQPRSTDPVRFRTNAIPTIAADHQGRVYIAWAARGFAVASGRVDKMVGESRIVLAVSSDGGKTFAKPYAIDDPKSPSGHQVMPSLTYRAGKLLIAFYDFREDPVPSGQYIDGDNHRAQVWAAEAAPAAHPTFRSFKVSSFRQTVQNVDGKPVRVDIEANLANLKLYGQGTVGFLGDYIDTAGLSAYPVQRNGVQEWLPNTGAGPIAGAATGGSPSLGGYPPLAVAFTAVTDNRDVVPPRDGNWTLYYPPNSPLATCDANGPRTGMRNANIYTSRLTPGAVVGSLGNTRPLGLVTRGTPPVVQHLQRGFVVFIQNTAKEDKFFRLNVANQPGTGFGDRATFFQLPAPPYSPMAPPPKPTLKETQIDVQVTPYSTFSRTVYVTADDTFAQVRVDVQELTASPGNPEDLNYPFDKLALKADGLKTSVLLNPDRTNPPIENPDVLSHAPPSILEEEVSDPIIFAPILTTITNPIPGENIGNAAGTTTRREESPREGNPREGTPREGTPREGTPRESTAGLENTAIADVSQYVVLDYQFKTSNAGNKTARYTFSPVVTKDKFPPGTQYQALVTKRSYLPAIDGVDCSLVLQYQNQVQVNMASFMPREGTPREGTPREGTPREGTAGEQTPREGTPRESTPREGTPREGTASFLAAPGDTYTATLRVFVPAGTTLARAIGRAPGGDPFRLSQPVDMVGFRSDPPSDKTRTAQSAVADGNDLLALSSPADPKGVTLADVPLMDRAPRPLYAGALGGIVQELDVEPPEVNDVGAKLIAASIDTEEAAAGETLPESVSATGDLITSDPKPTASVSSIAPGGSFTFSWTLTNIAQGAANRSRIEFHNWILLSMTPILGASDLVEPIPLCAAQPPQPGRACLLANTAFRDEVPANAHLPQPPQTLTIPRSVPPGNYSVIVVADADSAIFEDGYANNGSEGDAAWALSVAFNAAFAVEPTNATENLSISPAVRVALFDAAGQPVPAADVPQLAISLGFNPAGGTLSGTTVRPNVNGVVTFDDLRINNPGTGYRLQSAGALSAPFNIVSQLRPNAASQSITTAEDTAVSGTLTATDPESNPITFAIDTNGTQGTAVVTNASTGAFSYTPNADANGTDSFTFLANDGTVNSAPATVTVTTTPVNDPPSFTRGPNLDVTGSDPQTVPGWATDISAGPPNEAGQPLFFAVTTSPLFAAQPAIAPDGTLTFTPAATANGTAVLTVTLSDGTTSTPPQQFSITVTTNTAPVANDDQFTTAEGEPLTTTATCGPINFASFADVSRLTLNGNAAAVSTGDGRVLRLVAGTTWQRGSAFTTAPTSVARFNTTFQFRMTGNGSEIGEPGYDGQGAGADGLVFVLQKAGASALGDVGGRLGYAADFNGDTGMAPSVAVEFDTFWNGEYGDTDSNHVGVNINGTVFSLEARNVPGRFDDGELWTAWIDYDGTTLEIRVSADGVRPALPTMSGPIDIVAILGSSTAFAGFTSSTGQDFENADIVNWTYSSCASSVLANDTDPDGDPLTASLATGPSNGEVSLNSDGSFTYTPNANFAGVDSFTYTASDGTLTSAPATVTIVVRAANGAPVAVDDTYTTNEDTPLQITAAEQTVLQNDSDPEGSALSATLGTEPLHGTVEFNLFEINGAFRYTPAADFNGFDSFTYTVSDGQNQSAPATVLIAIDQVNDPPSFVKGANEIAFGGNVQRTVPNWATFITAGPADEADQPLNFVVSTDHPFLFSTQPAISPAGTLTYTTASSANGFANVTVRLRDNGGPPSGAESAPQTFTIQVRGPFTITTETLPDGFALQTYVGCLNSTNGVFPIDWEVSGSVPAGMAFPEAGSCFDGSYPAHQLMEAGTFTFTVHATDSSNPPQLAQRTYTIRVHAHDQQGYGSDNPTVVDVEPSRRLAQVFTAGTAYDLTGVQLPLSSCTVNTTITATVWPVAGAPARPDEAGAPLASGSVTLDHAGYAGQLMFTQAVPMPQHANFAVVLALQNGSCEGVNWPTYDYYTGGDGFVWDDDGPWKLLSEEVGSPDLAMTTIVLPTDLTFLRTYQSFDTAVTLGDDRVLLLGSDGAAEIYDPTVVPPTSTRVGNMKASRVNATATFLPDSNTVLVVGGAFYDGSRSVALTSTEIFHPDTGEFSDGATLSIGRYGHSATLLPTGKVLITGGWSDNEGGFNAALQSAHLLDANGNVTATLNMTGARADHAATLLPGEAGRVLITGGWIVNPSPPSSAEIYDPEEGFVVAAPMAKWRTTHTATVLTTGPHTGDVLIAGGTVDYPGLATTSELYSVSDDEFTTYPGLIVPRMFHTATALDDGRVLFAGGNASWTSQQALASLEIYDPDSQTFAAAGHLRVDRQNHTAGTIGDGPNDGKVFVAGGYSNSALSPRTAEIVDTSGSPLVITLAALPDGAVGSTYPSPLLTASGGSGEPYTFSIAWGTLPPGLTLQGNVIQGGPTAGGRFSFVVQVSDATGHIAQQDFTIVVNRLSFTSPSQLPAAAQDRDYSHQLEAAGVGNVKFTLENGGAAPPGLTLTESGLLHGTAGSPGYYYFSVRARDAVNQVAVQSFNLQIEGLLTVATTSLSDATAPWNYGGCLWSSGGSYPYTWEYTGSLPPGVLLGEDGCFSGPVLKTGTYHFAASVRDSAQQSPFKSLTIRSGIVEQAAWSIDQTTPFNAIAFGSNSVEVAQTFTPQVSGNLLSIGMPVSCSSGGLTLQIRGVSDGTPNGVVLGIENIPLSELAPFMADFAYHRMLRLSTPVFVTAGTPVAVVLSSAGTCSVVQAPGNTEVNTYSYPYGDGWTGSGSTWTGLHGDRPDIPFQATIDEGGRFAFVTPNHHNHGTATLLDSGLVLRIGGYTATTDVYNPTTADINGLAGGRFAAGPNLPVSLAHHTATKLADGWVLIAGGLDTSETQGGLATARLYNPATGTFVELPPLTTARFLHTATLLGSGDVLLAGGHATYWNSLLESTEIFHYDPLTHTGSFQPGPMMHAPRASHAAELLSGDRVLITGGSGMAAEFSAEVYEAGMMTPVGPMQIVRVDHTATRLTCPASAPDCAYDGHVLIAGGVSTDGWDLALAGELFDPQAGTFTRVGSISGRLNHRAVALTNGTVLLAGGITHVFNNSNGAVAVTELFDPATMLFTRAADLAVPRADPEVVHLANDSVLILGGYGPSQAPWSTGEVFDPASDVMAAGVAGQRYFATVTGVGTGPYTFAIRSGVLPAGLSLNPSTGAIHGTPTASSVSQLVVEITDSSVPPRHVFRAVTIVVNGGAASMRLPFREGRVDEEFALSLDGWATGVPPITNWQIEPGFGSMPPGLSLDSSTGALTGTPLSGGHFSFLIRATDSGSPQQDLIGRLRLNISQAEQRQLNQDTDYVHFGASSGLAQIVTVGAAGVLTTVRIPVYCTEGFVGITIRDAVSSGGIYEPGGLVIGSTYSFSPWGDGPSWTAFDVPLRQQPFVRAGQRLALVVTSTPQADCYVNAGAAGQTYLGGDGFSASDPWSGPWMPTGYDLAFETFVSPVAIANFGTATVDGTIAPGEWADAGVVNVFVPDNDGDLPATMLVMNDASNVHVALVRDTYFQPGEVRFGLNVNTDNNNDGTAYQTGEDVWSVNGDGLTPAWFTDAFGSIANCPGSLYPCDYPPDTSAGGVQNGSGAVGRTDREVTIEVTHPFNTGDAKDVALALGQMFGLNVNSGVDGPDWKYYSQFPLSSAAIPVRLLEDAPNPSRPEAVSIVGAQSGVNTWTYDLTFPPMANYSIFQNATTITISGLCGVAAASGPTSTDFPPELDEVNRNWSAEVLNGGTAVRWTHVGPGTGNFGTPKHIFGFGVTASGATDGSAPLVTSGFSRDASRPLPDGTYSLDINIVARGPSQCGP